MTSPARDRAAAEDAFGHWALEGAASSDGLGLDRAARADLARRAVLPANRRRALLRAVGAAVGAERPPKAQSRQVRGLLAPAASRRDAARAAGLALGLGGVLRLDKPKAEQLVARYGAGAVEFALAHADGGRAACGLDEVEAAGRFAFALWFAGEPSLAPWLALAGPDPAPPRPLERRACLRLAESAAAAFLEENAS